MAIVFDSLSSWKFPFLDPVYQLSWATAFICDFLNFVVKKGLLGVFNCLFECLPVFTTSCCPVIVEKPTVFIQPLLFEMLGNFWFFCIFQPSLINDWSELINYMFQFDDIHNIWYVQCFKVWNNVIDKCSFLLTFRDYGEFQCLDNLFKIGILIERGAWSKDKWESERIE